MNKILSCLSLVFYAFLLFFSCFFLGFKELIISILGIIIFLLVYWIFWPEKFKKEFSLDPESHEEKTSRQPQYDRLDGLPKRVVKNRARRLRAESQPSNDQTSSSHNCN